MVPSAKSLNQTPCQPWVSCSRERVPTSRISKKCSPSGCGCGLCLKFTGKMIGCAEYIEVPPFAEVLFRENLPKIAAILGNPVDRVTVSGDGPIQGAAL